MNCKQDGEKCTTFRAHGNYPQAEINPATSDTCLISHHDITDPINNTSRVQQMCKITWNSENGNVRSIIARVHSLCLMCFFQHTPCESHMKYMKSYMTCL